MPKVQEFGHKKKMRLTDILNSPLNESQPSGDDEYYGALKDHYGDDRIISKIRVGDEHAAAMSGGYIRTEKSDNGDLFVRWIEDDERVLVLGIISRKGRLSREDVGDLRMWMGKLEKAIEDGKEVMSSVNSFSEPILDKIIVSLANKGVELDLNFTGTPISHNGKEWKNVVIKRK